MAHFQGITQGNRGETSRLGSKNSGIKSIARGWHDGITVFAYYDKDLKKNLYKIMFTGGSLGVRDSFEIGTFYWDKKLKKLKTK